MVRCYELADASDDDFLKAAGRIEAAGCLIVGGGGLVGYKVLNSMPAQARRDMRSPLPDETAPGMVNYHRKVDVMGSSPAIRQAVEKKEIDRANRVMEPGWNPAQLDPGETVLVEWWRVLELWNAAMRPFDELARWQHEHYVYGETSSWPIVVGFLEHTRQQRLAHGQYALTPRIGFVAQRDHGFGKESKSIGNCAHCGQHSKSLKFCKGCSKVGYCSRDCQKADWKTHKSACGKG